MAARYDLSRLVHPAPIQLQNTSSAEGEHARGEVMPLSARMELNSAIDDTRTAFNVDNDHLTETGVRESQDMRLIADKNDVVTQIINSKRDERGRREATSAAGVMEDERKAVPTPIVGTAVQIEYGGRTSTLEIKNPLIGRNTTVRSHVAY